MLPPIASPCRIGKGQRTIWRYGLTMKHFPFFLLFSGVAVGAWGHPLPLGETAVSQIGLEQRRAELRSALKAQRIRELPDNDQTLKNTPLNRHLTAHEKAELRQELRQQRLDAKMARQ